MELHVWVLIIIALVVGVFSARLVQRPGPDGRGAGLIAQIGLARTIVGSIFVLALCYPYRTTTDSFDDMVSKFSYSVLVASAIMGISFLLLWGFVAGADGAGRVISRFLVQVAAFFAWIFTADQLAHSAPGHAFWPVAWVFAAAFYFAGYFYIGRYWFGINEVHPQLGPSVTALTVLIMTGKELILDGPEELPLPLWLMINAAGLGTTLTLCVWEFVENAVDRPRLPSTCAVIGLLCTAGLVAVVLTGNVPCQGDLHVRCDRSSPSPSPSPGSVSLSFSLPQNRGVDLDSRPPAVQLPVSGVDLVYDNSYALGFVLHPGDANAAEWAGSGLPGRDDCARLVRGPGLGARGVQPRAGMMLCVGTAAGRVALLRVDDPSYSEVAFSGTLWP